MNGAHTLLGKYKVTNFRSVQDSGWIECDNVTTLVGANESGKSNLLLALWKLKPARGGKFDILHDMPVSMLSAMRNEPESHVFISAEFNMDAQSAEKNSEVKEHDFASDTLVEVGRYYDGHHELFFPNMAETIIEEFEHWTVSILFLHSKYFKWILVALIRNLLIFLPKEIATASHEITIICIIQHLNLS